MSKLEYEHLWYEWRNYRFCIESINGTLHWGGWWSPIAVQPLELKTALDIYLKKGGYAGLDVIEYLDRVLGDPL